MELSPFALILWVVRFLLLSLLFGGVFSPIIWRPPCVWHKIKAHGLSHERAELLHSSSNLNEGLRLAFGLLAEAHEGSFGFGNKPSVLWDYICLFGHDYGPALAALDSTLGYPLAGYQPSQLIFISSELIFHPFDGTRC